jgi:small GTP-binding protein
MYRFGVKSVDGFRVGFKKTSDVSLKQVRKVFALKTLVNDWLKPVVHQSLHKNFYSNDVDEMINSVGSVFGNNEWKASIDKGKLFILQPRMQFKSKARQSMSAELQLEESVSLIKTLNEFKIVDTHITSTKTIASKAIWKSGNIESLSKKISQSGADSLFIGIDKLTNLQIETLRKELFGNDPSYRIYDRYTIVLKIFKKHASSSIARLQIALAEIPYLRNRFVNKDLYIDIEKRIKAEISKQMETRILLNKARKKTEIPTISVIGYTNVGKTTLIKYLTDDEKLVPENKLFATLDVTYHGTSLANSKINVIFVDTIGFISDIPHNLINAFKVTLQDALEADLLIHVVDCAHPDFEGQETVVLDILKELEADSKISNMITVYNKYDKVKMKTEFMEKLGASSLAVSCKTGRGIDDLVRLVEKKIMELRNYLKLKLKIKQGSDEMNYLNKNCIVQEVEFIDDDTENYVYVHVLFDKQNAIKFTNAFPSVKVSRNNSSN